MNKALLFLLTLAGSCQKNDPSNSSSLSTKYDQSEGGIVVEGGGGTLQLTEFYELFKLGKHSISSEEIKYNWEIFEHNFKLSREEIENNFLLAGQYYLLRLQVHYFTNSHDLKKTNNVSRFDFNQQDQEKIRFTWHNDLYDHKNRRVWNLNNPDTFEIKMNSSFWESPEGNYELQQVCNKTFIPQLAISSKDCLRIIPQIIAAHELMSLKGIETDSYYVYSLKLLQLAFKTQNRI